MQGDAKVIEELNARLAEELTAINQYFVHAEMCEDWHYGRLAEAIKKRSITEMKHAEKLIERVLYLDGRPIVSNLNEVHIGALCRTCTARTSPPRSTRSRPTTRASASAWRRGTKDQGAARVDPRR